MRRLPILLSLVSAAPIAAAAMATAPEPATERMALATDSESHWVPFDLTPGNQIRFRMAIDGMPLTAILDTGVSVSVLSHRFTVANGMRVTPGTQALGVGGSVALGWTNGRALTIGGLNRDGGRIGVVDLPASATGGGEPVDALIGRDLTDRYAIDIDFAARRFRLLPSGRLPFAGETAPLSIAPRQHLYVSELTIGDVRLQPVIVDTGDGATLTMSSEAWRSLSRERLHSTTTLSYSVAGPVTTELTVLPSVRIGRAVLNQAETRIEPTGGFSATMGAAGRIGLGFLQRYRVLLDPRAGRMVLSAASDTGATPLRSTSGLLFSVAQDRLNVLHVMRGGPGAAGGWKAGEQICSIDGTPIDADYARNGLAYWSIGAPGRVVALGMCGGGVRRLTLQQFY